ncbi:hypothetical protein GCM10016455_07120 [Aliiroseovarius zhejiangensis]|uniref:DnaJ homologue subfamily C member 28 conserved domain-containing protein n=1 Tax=Aliiroseovarius zhejiangensis TaxID=1632025 RepID=A0ABQ3ISE2_9RHOB|nr:DUF1992 domain-containing protein [Aliiroseovarius zhejiangensis]GHE89432.1 hypothetical protein GCM10016455_07120 [Aliiroseovarius zhejiangensis]
MDHPLFDLVDQRIRDAQAAGEFDDLPGAGKPLPKVEDPENALLNRLIRDSNAVPEFVSLSRELRQLRDELAATGEPSRRHDILKDMSMMEARIAIARKAYR